MGGENVSDRLKEYRQHLVLAEQQAQHDYDKTVVYLSGGALGISFAFIDKVIATKPMASPMLLFAAWLCWGASISSALASYHTSCLALRRAIAQVDSGRIGSERPGGPSAIVTLILNAVSGSLFLVGLIFMIIFAASNMGGKP
jgi:hypothetical protein